VSENQDAALYLRASQLAKGELQYTDMVNAEKFLLDHGDSIRYCALWKKWLVWDGRRWKIDDSSRIYGKVKETIRKMYLDAAGVADIRDRLEMEKHAQKCESNRRMKNLLEIASWEKDAQVHPDELDRNDFLLNCGNGTIDLKTGKLKPHERSDFITKLANTDYKKEAACPTWKRFLKEIMKGNDGLVDFLRKATGWALTGDTSEQTLFILYGSGANGKSTFLGTLLDLLGDYAMPTPTDTFMRRTNDQISNDIARLRGTRLVTTIEAEQGKRLSEPLIKQITGNDRMTARFLYGEFFDFQPTFKIFMATNHRPVIRGTDHAMWRRIKLIPFTVTIPEEKQDKGLAEKLKKEYPGILSCLIDGCLAWRKEGLGMPPEVKEATESYRNDMDVIGTFLKERCFREEKGLRVQSRELFKAYQAWCEENNERAGSERLLALRLQELGIEKVRYSDARYWVGLRLKE